mmetsp:Transcript_17639/g.55190  ORF Transcript_17639/g.55190 Transcript_17639/m.55190 type:complete len:279 (+) Transcript_17639:2617-3453(+)
MDRADDADDGDARLAERDRRRRRRAHLVNRLVRLRLVRLVERLVAVRCQAQAVELQAPDLVFNLELVDVRVARVEVALDLDHLAHLRKRRRRLGDQAHRERDRDSRRVEGGTRGRRPRRLEHLLERAVVDGRRQRSLHVGERELGDRLRVEAALPRDDHRKRNGRRRRVEGRILALGRLDVADGDARRRRSLDDRADRRRQLAQCRVVGVQLIRIHRVEGHRGPHLHRHVSQPSLQRPQAPAQWSHVGHLLLGRAVVQERAERVAPHRERRVLHRRDA